MTTQDSTPPDTNPQDPSATTEPVVIRTVHKYLTEQRASTCPSCNIIQTPPVSPCPQCGKPTEPTSAMLRFLIERIAFVGFLIAALYVALIVFAITDKEHFEAGMLIIPPVGVFGAIFCLNYLGLPVRFNTLFTSENLPKWAERPFSWRRFGMEFVYTAVIWLAFAAASLIRFIPAILNKPQ